MSNIPTRTITENQAKLLSEIFRVIIKEITCDEDKEKLAPGELGIDYGEGTFYIKNPHTGELFCPNSIEHVRQILTKYDPDTNIMNADRISGIRFYSDIAQLQQLGIELSIDSIIRQMEYPSILMSTIHYDNYQAMRFPSSDGMVMVYKLSPEAVTCSFYDSETFISYDGRYNPNTQYFEGWVTAGSIDSTYLETLSGGDIVKINGDAVQDMDMITVRVTEDINPLASISYNGGEYLPILAQDGSPWGSTITTNNIIMLIYDEQRKGWILVQSTESAITAIIDVTTNRVNTMKKDLNHAVLEYTAKIDNLKTYVDNQVTALKQRPGTIITKISQYTAAIDNVDTLGAVADYVPELDKLVVNYGQTLLRSGIDYHFDGTDFVLNSIRLNKGDVIQFIVIKQEK